ncbi:hypothetical protein F2Q70_00004866 [Brassica cretica]|uniref:Uncharacterized protein n=1 Tax=Brassica cretica TaxID=69181 RepID=A0A8S9J130_BRACR|nr:hypothetical protein F2Q70_00004866 [Brassica cretica]
MPSTPHDSPLHDSPLHDSPLHDSHLHDSLQLDSNEFCTTLKLPGRVYEAVETPDNPKAIIHHSKIDYVEKVEDILGKEEFSLIENSHIGSILKLDSNEFCTTLKLPGRVYEAVETPDNPKAIIHHSKID